MTIKELLAMLRMFPVDALIHNCPFRGHQYKGDTEDLAFLEGDTLFNQNPTQTVAFFIEELERWVGRQLVNRQGEYTMTENAYVFLVTRAHQVGSVVKGVLVTPRSLRIMCHESW
jgi:hypothetical protein